MPAFSGKVVLVTGANRGLGWTACRQLAKDGAQVILTARNQDAGEEKAKQLQAEGYLADFFFLDVDHQMSIDAAYHAVKKKFGRLDVLINNAGICLDQQEFAPSKSSFETLTRTIETNLYGPFRLCQLFAPLMKEQGYGRIVNVSSTSGQLSTMGSQEPTYCISKAALNAMTCVFASEFHGTNVLINSVCPGWCHTDMGGEIAPRSPEKGVETILFAASLPSGGPTGRFFRDQQEIAW